MQAFADQMGEATGEDMGEKLAALDTDGDGSLSEAEFDAGRPSGPPGGGAQGVQGAGGPPSGPPPVGGAGGAGGAGASEDSTSYDPLDTNQDGVVSQLERLAGELKELASSDSSNGVSSEVAQLAQKLYEQISQTAWGESASTSGSQISVTA